MIPALLCLSLLQVPGQTEPAEIAAEPYPLTICLRTSDNPLLTPLWVASIAREVNDQLANYFGPLANVRVVTADHWLLEGHEKQEIEYPKLTPRELAAQKLEEKAFLVYMDYQGGAYRVQSRQIDTINDQLSPVRMSKTPDRWWVAKAICLSVRNSFSISAEVTPGAIVNTAQLRFRGEESREQLRNALGAKCILQPLWVVQYRGGRVERRPIPRTLLIWDSEGPMHRADVVTNLSNPWPQRALITGFEAVKLDTRRGRLRLRIIDLDTGEPVINCNVSAGDSGFDSLTEIDHPNRAGYIVTSRAFDDLAYVKVSQGNRVAMVPVAITSEVTDCEIRIRSDTAFSIKNEFLRAVRFLIQDTQSIVAVQAKARSDFNQLNSDKRYEEALEKVKGAIGFIDPRLQNAQTSFAPLKDQAEQLGMLNDSLFQMAQSQLQSITDSQTTLTGLRDDIKEAILTRDAQKRADIQIALGKEAEKIGDIDDAIAKYEFALAEHADQPELRRRLADLKAQWETKSNAHAQARNFIVDQWATAEVTEIESLLPQAIESFATLKAHDDKLTARRLTHINNAHVGEVSNLLSQMSQRQDQADTEEVEKYDRLNQRLIDFQVDLNDFMLGTNTSPAAGTSPAEDSSQNPPADLTPPSDDGSSILDIDIPGTEEEPLPQ